MYQSHRRSPRNLTLNKAFPNWASGGGIFAALDSDNSMPWHGEANISSVGLDMMYHGAHSGDKFVAPIVYNWLDDTGALTQTGISNIVSALKAKYLQKWSHIWTIYSQQYSPLDSYKITETLERTFGRVIDSTKQRTDNLSAHTVTSDDTQNSGTDTVTTTPNGADTEEHYVKGFNETPAVLSDKTVSTPLVVTTEATAHGQKTERDVDEAVSNTGTQTVTEDTTNDDTEEYTKTRAGRMYNTPAEMLKADREFWTEDYFSQIFSDIDKLLTLDIYSDSKVQLTVF